MFWSHEFHFLSVGLFDWECSKTFYLFRNLRTGVILHWQDIKEEVFNREGCLYGEIWYVFHQDV